jgi:hypothetical protein
MSPSEGGSMLYDRVKAFPRPPRGSAGSSVSADWLGGEGRWSSVLGACEKLRLGHARKRYHVRRGAESAWSTVARLLAPLTRG